MSQKREFTGVFIPAHIWYSKELTPDEKYILVEMLLLNYTNEGPESLTKHLADAMQCTQDSLIDPILNLQKFGYIVIDKEKGKIWLTDLLMSKS